METNQIKAKLLCIQREYNNNFNISDSTMDMFLSFCRGQLKRFDETFIPINRREEATNELALFILGERSAFDRFVN